MTQKEYVVIDLVEERAKDQTKFEAMLNDMGKEGWAPTSLNYGSCAIFVRDKPIDVNDLPKSELMQKIRKRRNFTKKVGADKKAVTI